MCSVNSLLEKLDCAWFWAAQRFSAAISGFLAGPALAAAVILLRNRVLRP
jgi:hypothetical protein